VVKPTFDSRLNTILRDALSCYGVAWWFLKSHSLLQPGIVFAKNQCCGPGAFYAKNFMTFTVPNDLC
jgi:hypothetical protein